jgi:four helix bundle protein
MARSHALVLEVYQLTAAFPATERFGIVSQLRRAAISVPTNIAEGAKRQGRQEYARFINMAKGSFAETEYLLLLSRDLGYLSPKVSERPLAEATEISRIERSTGEGGAASSRQASNAQPSVNGHQKPGSRASRAGAD